MSGENHEGNKSPDICDGNDQRRFLCSQTMKPRTMKGYEAHVSALERSKRKGHRNVQRQIRLSLKATFKEGRTPICPKADRAVSGKQRSKEGRTPKCPKADKAVTKSNVQRGEDTEMSKG
jgi:hypothetical protein